MLLHLFGLDHNQDPYEVASAPLGQLSQQQASFSVDGGALLVPRLRVAATVVRRVARGATLYALLHGVLLLQADGDESRLEPSLWSYVWGDLEVFETGEPLVNAAVLLRGTIEAPDLTLVMRYVREMKKRASSPYKILEE